jgi:hypothetical protein
MFDVFNHRIYLEVRRINIDGECILLPNPATHKALHDTWGWGSYLGSPEVGALYLGIPYQECYIHTI